MTLTNRLALAALGSLAVVLAGYSLTLYLLASDHLTRQADEQLDAALNTLVAAMEVGPKGVEWEPDERVIRVTGGGNVERIVWQVTDRRGRPVAGSVAAKDAERLVGPEREPGESGRQTWRAGQWQVERRWVVAAADVTPLPGNYAALAITAAQSLEPVHATLRRLAGVLVGVSVAVLALAALACRAVCRRALRPMAQMAADARWIDPADAGLRLSVPTSGDELADLGLAFNGLLDRLHAALDRQRRFAGDASHQLRTPLAGLLGQVEVALRRDRTPDEYRATLRTVQAKATQLTRLVEALLRLARADFEATPANEPLDLADWLPTHLATWADHPRASDLTCSTDGKRAEVMTHPILLGELLNVLIDNACRYSPAGSPIAVRAATVADGVEIAVSDAGPGIRQDEWPHLFEPFRRSPEAARYHATGVGLGLAIARRLASTMGGRLAVGRAERGGARLSVTLNRGCPQATPPLAENATTLR